ncbi:TY-Chap domain-containing protein [Actinocorallia populi]|uniref:TY-Chap domain-containing protein n=1 Tax=Actinocorallia populi TaxID=2079200 RepID=UPI000D08D756|nr:hypothetical protein [Actinocorallia populi]
MGETLTNDQKSEDAEWDVFTAHLAAFLSGLPAGAKLVLRAGDHGFAQFAAEVSRLDAEVASNAFLKEPWRMSADDERWLAADGWELDEEPLENWRRSVDRTPEGYSLAAEKVVGALRTALRVPGPGSIAPDGWVDHRGVGNVQLDLTGLGLGMGQVPESNARAAMHAYMVQHGLPRTSGEFQGVRAEWGWAFTRERDAEEFCVSHDHCVERRPEHVPSGEFREGFERRYRERNGLSR